jgi:hypothetical protein
VSGREDLPAQGYEPPQVENVPAEDGPAITAAGKTVTPGVEWRPTDDTGEERE